VNQTSESPPCHHSEANEWGHHVFGRCLEFDGRGFNADEDEAKDVGDGEGNGQEDEDFDEVEKISCRSVCRPGVNGCLVEDIIVHKMEDDAG